MQLVTYFREVAQETKKVTWPTQQQTINMTLLVLGVSVVVALFLMALDFLIQNGINWLITAA